MSDKMVLTPIQRLSMLKGKVAVLLPSFTDSQRAKALYIQGEPSEIMCKNEWQSTEGGLLENEIKFCPYFGSAISNTTVEEVNNV